MQVDDFEIQPKDLEFIQSVERDRWLHIYRQILRIRRFEQKIGELFEMRQIPGPAHLYIGQEAVAVGVCEALRRDDYITSTHRGHGHCLAKGASPDRMLAEVLGKAPGYCRGKGGSMHIVDPDTGNLGSNGIVGGSAGIATGAALSASLQETDRVAVCFFGDGALGQGLLYEAMNMAVLWKLPILYVCENNLYGQYSHNSQTTAGSLRARPEAFGIHTEEVDGQDVRLVHVLAHRLIERVRRREGPAFLHCHTYRFGGHYLGDKDRPYRSREEEDFWKAQRDPLKIMAAWLLEQEMANDALLEGIGKEVRNEMESGVQFALDAPYPEPTEVDLVYA